MSWMACILIAAAAQLPPHPMPAGPGAPGAQPQMMQDPPALKMRMLALQASTEGIDEPFVDPDIEWFKSVLKALPFDTFVLAAAEEQELPPGEAVRFPIDELYDAYVEQQGPVETGEIGLGVRITLEEDGNVLDAVRATCKAAPNQALVFRGLSHEQGELVVILGLTQDSEDHGQQQNQEQQQDQEQQEEQKDEEEQQQQEQPKPNEDQQNQEQTSEEPKDRQDIEAILEMLEEMDNREQSEARERRKAPQIRGDWW